MAETAQSSPFVHALKNSPPHFPDLDCRMHFPPGWNSRAVQHCLPHGDILKSCAQKHETSLCLEYLALLGLLLLGRGEGMQASADFLATQVLGPLSWSSWCWLVWVGLLTASVTGHFHPQNAQEILVHSGALGVSGL